MKKLNLFLRLAVFASLLTFPFLIGCAESEREIIFPDLELPESVTIVIEDVPKGTTLNLAVSTDYNIHRDNLGYTVIIHNKEEKYSVTEDFSKTIIFDSEEPSISVKLTCTKIDSINENSSNSVHLIVQFNGDGNFDRQNFNHKTPFELGTYISLQSLFSRHVGTSTRRVYSLPD